jgi:hypothetical protein
MPLNFVTTDLNPKVQFNAVDSSGGPAVIGGTVFTVDDPICSFQNTGDGKSALVKNMVPGTTTVHATAVNVLNQPVSATPDTLTITGPVAVGGTIVRIA